MKSLDTPPLAPLIERLFQEADAAKSQAWENIPSEDCSRLMQSKTEYIDFYGLLKDLWLPVSRETARMLYMLARSSNAKTIVEFGTSFGISTVHLAAALRDNGEGGKLITTEFEPSKIARAKGHIKEGCLSELVEFRQGDALETLKDNMPETIDFLLLDGAKALYVDILTLLESRLKPGALIVADDTNYCPDYLEYINDPKNGYISVPFADDIELTMKTNG